MNFTIHIYKRLVFAFLLAPSLVLSAPTPPVGGVAFFTYDADTDRKIIANIFINGDPVKNGILKLKPNAESQIALDISVDAGDEYYPRHFRIFLEGLTPVSQVAYNLYLAKKQKNIIYSRGAINKYAGDSSQDKAAVLLERAKDESPASLNESQYYVFMMYNLASAYYKNCTKSFIDQCQKAADIYNDLDKRFDNYQRFFDAEHIKRDELKKLNVDEFYNRMKYRKAKWDISGERYKEAVDTYDELIALGGKDSSTLDKINLTLEQLNKDKGYVTTLLKRKRK